ncbi:hypothetical protein LENED_000677 [Lentinula edodes]|uniref:Uncharacterized protein n=1 Tax=Lentinula edodes TaxID=5353 RepID=A0A1Q3DW64_LENED|nr:hypothetical protein LENED_000677 [Lentinula edodes]
MSASLRCSVSCQKDEKITSRCSLESIQQTRVICSNPVSQAVDIRNRRIAFFQHRQLCSYGVIRFDEPIYQNVMKIGYPQQCVVEIERHAIHDYRDHVVGVVATGLLHVIRTYILRSIVRVEMHSTRGFNKKPSDTTQHREYDALLDPQLVRPQRLSRI